MSSEASSNYLDYLVERRGFDMGDLVNYLFDQLTKLLVEHQCTVFQQFSSGS